MGFCLRESAYHSAGGMPTGSICLQEGLLRQSLPRGVCTGGSVWGSAWRGVYLGDSAHPRPVNRQTGVKTLHSLAVPSNGHIANITKHMLKFYAHISMKSINLNIIETITGRARLI